MSKDQPATSPRPRIIIAAGEHTILQGLADKALQNDSPIGEYLVDELSRASIVPDGECAPNVVRMGSTVTYREDATARIRKVTLVYPHEADIAQQRVSILTPIGAALIGMSTDQAIQWPSPGGAMESLTVLDVSHD